MNDKSVTLETIVLDSESTQKIDTPKEEQADIILFPFSTSTSDFLDSQTETISEACRIANASLRNHFISRFRQLIQESDFEFGFSTPADEYVSEALNRYGSFAREWINELFLQSFNDLYVTSSILRVIAHFDYHQIYPQGVTMAIGATSHESADVRECGIRCFENWEAPENLNILYYLSYSEGWLKDYLAGVINELEDIKKHAICR